jgi:hypothetical protein
LIIGRQVFASFGTKMMPSTLRVMKFFYLLELAICVLVGNCFEHCVPPFLQVRSDRLETRDPVFSLQCLECDANREASAGRSGRCGLVATREQRGERNE